jgi:hypothetical protein
MILLVMLQVAKLPVAKLPVAKLPVAKLPVAKLPVAKLAAVALKEAGPICNHLRSLYQAIRPSIQVSIQCNHRRHLQLRIPLFHLHRFHHQMYPHCRPRTHLHHHS